MIYINACSSISSQKTLYYNELLEGMIEYNTELLQLLKINYKKYLSSLESRRMSKLLKSSIVCSDIVLNFSEIKKIDAIIIGTGLGMLSDTEIFLERMIYDNERYLTPTAFVQSTHNTIAAQIALRTKCNSYNYTYVNKGFPFELALLDGIMQLSEGKKNVLVGGADEMTKKYFDIIKKTGQWKVGDIKNTELLHSQIPGALRGEGVAFFVLSTKKHNNYFAKIRGVEMIYKPLDINEINKRINDFLYNYSIELSDIDLVILGNNGDNISDKIYNDLMTNIFSGIPAAYLSGEYQTAVSFALWLGSNILKYQKYPSFIMLNNKKNKKIKNIIIYNQYLNSYNSLILITK